MNLRELQYFNKLVELRNYSHTAHFFGVTQPTISYTIKRLEEQVGSILLDRKTMDLTLAGRQFYTHTQKIVLEADLLDKDMEYILSPRFKVGIPPIISNYLLHDKNYSKVIQKYLPDLEVLTEESLRAFQGLITGRLDAAFIGSIQPISADNLNAQVLTRQRFKIVCSTLSALSEKKLVSFADLIDENFLLLDRDSTHQQVFEQLTSRYLFNPNIIFQTSDFQMVLNLIEKNSGISFLATSALTNHRNKLATIDLKEAENLYFYISIVSRNNPSKKKNLENFLQEIAAT